MWVTSKLQLFEISSQEVFSIFLIGYLYTRIPALVLATGPNLYLMVPALNLYLPALVLNFCLPDLRFTVKVCYSQPHFQCVFSLFYSYKI